MEIFPLQMENIAKRTLAMFVLPKCKQEVIKDFLDQNLIRSNHPFSNVKSVLLWVPPPLKKEQILLYVM